MIIQIHKNRIRKVLTLALLLCLGGVWAGAQSFKESEYNKRIFTVNYAPTFSGDGDCWGFGNSISHTKTFGKRFFHRQNLASWLINSNSWIKGGYENQGGIDLSAEIGFVPFKNGERIFAISGGLCGARLLNISPSSGGTWSYQNLETGELSYVQAYDQSFENGFDIGFMFGLSYYRQLSPAVYLNARADFRSHYFYSPGISMIGIGIGFDSSKLFNTSEK